MLAASGSAGRSTAQLPQCAWLCTASQARPVAAVITPARISTGTKNGAPSPSAFDHTSTAPAAITRAASAPNSGPSPMTTAAAQPSASGSRAASACMRPAAAERASMPPDRSTAATCGHTCAISGVSSPVPEAISTARPGRNGPPRARASASTGRRYPPREASQPAAAASKSACMAAASARSQVPGRSARRRARS